MSVVVRLQCLVVVVDEEQYVADSMCTSCYCLECIAEVCDVAVAAVAGQVSLFSGHLPISLFSHPSLSTNHMDIA